MKAFGFRFRWSKTLVMVNRQSCLFIWRGDAKWHSDFPVWRLNLPFAMVLEKWRKR
jgi:hypothetical protein